MTQMLPRTDGPVLTSELLQRFDTGTLIPALRKEARAFLNRNKHYLIGMPIHMVQDILAHRAEGRDMREMLMAMVSKMSDDELSDYTRYAVAHLREAASTWLRGVAFWEDVRRTVGSVLSLGLLTLFSMIEASIQE